MSETQQLSDYISVKVGTEIFKDKLGTELSTVKQLLMKYSGTSVVFANIKLKDDELIEKYKDHFRWFLFIID